MYKASLRQDNRFIDHIIVSLLRKLVLYILHHFIINFFQFIFSLRLQPDNSRQESVTVKHGAHFSVFQALPAQWPIRGRVS